MGSVVVSWKGPCPDREARGALLSYLEELARRNEARWAAPPAARPAFLEVLTGQREEGLPVLPDVRRFDGEVSGRILISCDVAADGLALLAEAQRRGVAAVPFNPEDEKPSLMVVDRAVLRGVDFRLFDPRGLYPGEDRMSFVFLESDVPCLDGRVVTVGDKAWCRLSRAEAVRGADWFLECPYTHLRYYLEEWTDILFGWMKFFFMPDLTYWRYEALPNYEEIRDVFEEMRGRMGEEEARAWTFETLLDRFEAQADEWLGKMKEW